MAAPLSNQFWKNRSSHGRKKLFESAELLKEEIQVYFNWCDSNPWWRNEPIKSGEKAGETMKIKIARPYTISGMCLYLDASESFWKNFRKNTNLSQDFLSVIEWAEEVIRTQKFEGAAVGTFNANIIARDLGMVDKKEVDFPVDPGTEISVKIKRKADSENG